MVYSFTSLANLKISKVGVISHYAVPGHKWPLGGSESLPDDSRTQHVVAQFPRVGQHLEHAVHEARVAQVVQPRVAGVVVDLRLGRRLAGTRQVSLRGHRASGLLNERISRWEFQAQTKQSTGKTD